MTADCQIDLDSFCTFRLDDLLFGVEVHKVQEVIRSQPTTQVPKSLDVVYGLMNLRGQIVTTLDLRQRIGLPPNGKESEAMNVVLRTTEGPVSLLVDRIGDVVRVDRDYFEPPPETLQGIPRELIQGAFKLDQDLLMILDSDRVIDLSVVS